MARFLRRYTLITFLFLNGFIWFTVTTFFSNKLPRRESFEEKKFDEVVMSKLYLENRHRFEPPPLSQEILDLHKQLNLSNPGNMGKPVIIQPELLTVDLQKMVNKSRETYSFNEFVSSLIPFYRELPDIRPDCCKSIEYSENLPVTSVIMVFHNEPESLLLRTVLGVLNRTPPELLGEIVLVDDCSDKEPLKEPLERLIKAYPKVKLIRSPMRVGLIKARMIGCVNAEGPALVFMDAHIEVTEGWLEPLLEPIAKNPNTTTLPTVSNLDRETLEFKYIINQKTFYVGGLGWEMSYEWKTVPDWEKKNRTSSCDPLRSPTMLGAFFVIRKDYFKLLGMYDPEFEIWGGENLELSFKVWMCGGQQLQIPCSQVAHLFRRKHPYKYPKGGTEIRKNTDRLAEVWLDEYKRFYHRAIKVKNTNFGDISMQVKLRQDLGCKSFKWYIENVYPDVIYPKEITDPPISRGNDSKLNLSNVTMIGLS